MCMFDFISVFVFLDDSLSISMRICMRMFSSVANVNNLIQRAAVAYCSISLL